MLGQLAVEAFATGDHKGYDHPVARADLGNPFADLFHDPHEFVSEHVAVMQIRNLAAVEMQIGTADCSGGDAQDEVVIGSQHGVRHGFNAHILAAVVGQCLHCRSPSGR